MLKSTPKREGSRCDVARILAALRAGIDPGKLTREIAARHADNPGAAGRFVELGLACLWLAEGAPASDVVTMLKTRHRFELSSAACRAYADEILWATDCQMKALDQDLNPTPKEHEYAAA